MGPAGLAHTKCHDSLSVWPEPKRKDCAPAGTVVGHPFGMVAKSKAVPLQPAPLVSLENIVANLEPRMAGMTVQMNTVQRLSRSWLYYKQLQHFAELRALQAAAAPVPGGRGADDKRLVDRVDMRHGP